MLHTIAGSLPIPEQQPTIEASPAPEVLGRDDALVIVERFQAEEPLQPADLRSLASYTPESTFEPSEKVAAGLVLVGAGVYAVLGALKDEGYIGAGFQLPGIISAFSDRLNGWNNFATGTDDFTDHVAMWGADTAIFSTGLLYRAHRRATRNAREQDELISTKSAEIADTIEAGELRWKMDKGHTALFVGSGSEVASLLLDGADTSEDPYMTYASERPNTTNIWALFESSRPKATMEMQLGRGDYTNAGEAIILTSNAEQIFLPHPTIDSMDIQPQQAESLIIAINAFDANNNQQNAGVPTAKIALVGDTRIERPTNQFLPLEGQDELDVKADRVTSLASIAKKYDNVEAFDPTDITFERLKEIANGRHMVFYGSDSAGKEYGNRFYAYLESTGYAPTSDEVVFVGIDETLDDDDTTTEALVIAQDNNAHERPDFIPIVTKQNAYDTLTSMGYDETQIVFVPELVKQAIEDFRTQQ